MKPKLHNILFSSSIFIILMCLIISSISLNLHVDGDKILSPKASNGDDAWEENDFYYDAKVLESGYYSGFYQYDDDWYNFTARYYDCSIIEITHSAPQGSLDILVYDRFLTQVYPLIISEDGKLTMKLSSSYTGEYLLRIWGTNTGWTYEINFYYDSVCSSSTDDSFEDNDDYYYPKEISMQFYTDLKSYDMDCYSIYMYTMDQILITITFNSGTYFSLNQYQLYPYFTLGTSDYSYYDGSLQIQPQMQIGYIYFVVLSNNNGDWYNLNITTQVKVDDMFEENDQYDTPAEVYFQKYTNLICWDKDHYAISLAKSQSVKVTLDFQPGFYFRVAPYKYDIGMYWVEMNSFGDSSGHFEYIITKEDDSSEFLYFYVEGPSNGNWYNMEITQVALSTNPFSMNIPGFPLEWISGMFILGIILLISKSRKGFLK